VIALVADAGGTRIKVALMRERSRLAQECLDAHSHEGLAGLLFTFLLVPETKVRTLENIEASWDMPQHDHVPSTRELRHE
jgi:hypothetical protein